MALADLGLKEGASKVSGRSAAVARGGKNAVGTPESGAWLTLTFSFHSLFPHEQTPLSF